MELFTACENLTNSIKRCQVTKRTTWTYEKENPILVDSGVVYDFLLMNLVQAFLVNSGVAFDFCS